MTVWKVFTRRKVQANGHGGWVMGPGQDAGTVDADTKKDAYNKARRYIPDSRVEIVICSQASWNASGSGERDRLLGNFAVPDETQERKALRTSTLKDRIPTERSHDG